jgi:hypothetical protein
LFFWFVLTALLGFFSTQIYWRERKVLCLGQVAAFEIGTRPRGWWFFLRESYWRERKVLCAAQVAMFEIGARLFFGSLLGRLRGGRLLFPLRRKK